MILCVIMDKDAASRKNVAGILKDITHLTLVKCCKNIVETTDVLKNNRTDILFIDTAGAGKDCLKFLDSLDYARPHIIVTGSDTEAAKDAFDMDAVDFVPKPITSQRVLKALSKVLNAPSQVIQRKGNNTPREFFVKQNSHFEKIDVNSICRIEALA